MCPRGVCAAVRECSGMSLEGMTLRSAEIAAALKYSRRVYVAVV